MTAPTIPRGWTAAPWKIDGYRWPDPGEACLYAAEAGWLVGCWDQAYAPQVPLIDRGYYCFHRGYDQKFALCRVETHYEWRLV
jgi:hypothetical protein